MNLIFSLLFGIWSYDGFIFEGQRYPKPNPDLNLEFSFQPDGVSRLVWTRTNEREFCERLAKFEINDDLLYLKTFWLNPKNSPSCGSDQDMQIDRETYTYFTVDENELQLLFNVDGEPFHYVLKRMTYFRSNNFR